MLGHRGRMQTSDHRLTERCHTWINGIKSHYAGKPSTPNRSGHRSTPFAFKLLGDPRRRRIPRARHAYQVCHTSSFMRDDSVTETP